MVASGAVATAVDGASIGTIDGRVLVSQIAVDLTVSPATIRIGDLATAQATVENLGPEAAGRISVRLRVPAGLLVRGRQPQTIRGLGPGTSGSATWSLCGRAPGRYLVFAEATFGTIVIDSPARLVTVVPGPGHCPTTGGPKHG